MFRANRYRTHRCGEVDRSLQGQTVTLAGWIHRKRNFGGLLFLVLRDHSGIVQIVVDTGAEFHFAAENVRLESVVQISGEVALRDEANINPNMPTGEIEILARSFEIHSAAEILPFPVADESDAPESERLRYRFLDLRRERLNRNMLLRSMVVQSIRRRMTEMNFFEFQTPILTSSSPEGARDYLVPSRVHPGKFYALPQAPQQFKQLLMVSGFPRYFQIAPCFRDEDARADRSPGEFYQLDLEMAFAEQDDVFEVLESLLGGLFAEFTDWRVTAPPFPRLTYRHAMLRYGTDKPDLRFACEIQDVSDLFRASELPAFRAAIESGGVVRALPIPAASQSRKFFDGFDAFVKEQGGKGCAWIAFPEDSAPKGSIAKFLDEGLLAALEALPGAGRGSAILFLAGEERATSALMGRLRAKAADELDLREKEVYRFCWIVDFPMYEWDEEHQKVDFSHNPFSMPQGGMEALTTQDPLEILAFQYDIVCNGVELSSGAIRNHRPDIMYRAFEIAGYDASVVDEKFGGMIRAFRYGAPPHGGIAPGVDRIVMLIANEPNIREVILFPMNQKAEDLLMGAPSTVRPEQLEELHIRMVPPKGG